MRANLILLLLLAIAAPLSAQEAVIDQVQNDLDNATKRHGETVQQIAAEKIPLVRELDELDDQVTALSKELKALEKEEASRTTNQVGLENQVKIAETGVNFI